MKCNDKQLRINEDSKLLTTTEPKKQPCLYSILCCFNFFKTPKEVEDKINRLAPVHFV